MARWEDTGRGKVSYWISFAKVYLCFPRIPFLCDSRLGVGSGKVETKQHPFGSRFSQGLVTTAVRARGCPRASLLDGVSGSHWISFHSWVFPGLVQVQLPKENGSFLCRSSSLSRLEVVQLVLVSSDLSCSTLFHTCGFCLLPTLLTCSNIMSATTQQRQGLSIAIFTRSQLWKVQRRPSLRIHSDRHASPQTEPWVMPSGLLPRLCLITTGDAPFSLLGRRKIKRLLTLKFYRAEMNLPDCWDFLPQSNSQGPQTVKSNTYLPRISSWVFFYYFEKKKKKSRLLKKWKQSTHNQSVTLILISKYFYLAKSFLPPFQKALEKPRLTRDIITVCNGQHRGKTFFFSFVKSIWVIYNELKNHEL